MEPAWLTPSGLCSLMKLLLTQRSVVGTCWGMLPTAACYFSRMIRFRHIATLMLVIPACAACTNFERPTVEITGVSIGDASLSGVDVHVHLDMYNPNTRELPIRTIDFDLKVGDSDPVPGHGELTENLPPEASTPVTVTIRVSPRAALSVGREIAAGRTDYHIDGHVVASSWIGDVEVPFEKSGDLLPDESLE